MFAKLKTAWRTFNHWRRSAFPFRLTVLLILLMFASGLPERAVTPNHSLLINQWVWDACQAMRNYCEPQVESAYLLYYRARENQRLQNELRVRMQGGLRLSPDDLAVVNARPSKVDNKLLFEIGKRHGIISPGVSQREYMRSMWAASLSMTAMEFDKDWDEVKHDVFNTGKLFGGRRGDWNVGIERFGYVLAEILPLPLSATVPWFIICLTLAYIVAGNSGHKWRYGLAILLPAAFTLLLCSPAWFEYTWYNRLFFEKTWRGNDAIYFLLLATVTGIFGIRLKRFVLERKADDIAKILLLFISGFLLMFPYGFFPESRIYYNMWFEVSFSPGYILRHVSPYTTLLFCLAGAVMIAHAVKSCFRVQVDRLFHISPELLCYLLWGVTAVWVCYLLSLVDLSAFNILLLNFDAPSTNIPIPLMLESNTVTGQEIIAAGFRITAFIGSILCGLLLARPCFKKYFRTVNICAIVLLIAIFAVLTFFISCQLQKYYSSSKGSYIKVTFI